MQNCEYCGREVMLPFTCAYCGGSYCAEHRLPETHQCLRRPKGPPPYLLGQDNNSSEKAVIAKPPTTKKSRFSPKKVIAYSAVLLLTGVLIWFAYSSFIQTQNPTIPFTPSTTPSMTPSSSSTPQPTPSTSNTPKPTITPDTGNYQELVDYALSLINSDRQSRGLQTVTLSEVGSGQRHADELLENHVLSHWDTNGYKPYMRYTLEGGKGAVSENCAWFYISYGLDPVQALEKLEHDMMYDGASSNWGHRDNIIDPNHNRVSIGIAYNNNNIYLVQDFEDDYVSWNVLSVNNNQVTLQGTIQEENFDIQQIAIFYDNPVPLTSSQLEQAQYQDGYDAGTYVGLVLLPSWQATDGITITADSWTQSGNDFQISFSLSQAFTAFGKGVYTLYLETGSSTADALLSYSIWLD
jgi:uncharacterized protein YkwD